MTKARESRMMKETIPGTRAVAQRIVNAEQLFVRNVTEFASLSEDDAYTVFHAFLKAKVIKLDAINGRYDLKHGAFWDKAVFARAIEFANAATKTKGN